MTIEATIDAAQAQDTFDVLSFIEGTAYPTENVVIYTDPKSATELLIANQKRKDNELNADSDGVAEKVDEELTKEIEILTAKVKGSALTFSLRGLPPGLVQDIYALPDGEEGTTEKQLEAEDDLIAKTIVGVKNAAGAEDPQIWDSHKIAQLRRFLKEGEFGKLIQGVIRVNFNASVFDQATDAGFLGGSSDVES